MRASEIFLGIGGSLGGWLVLTGHALILSVVPKVDCSVESLDPWRGTLVMGALGLLTLPLLGRGLPWRAGLRWATLPVIPLALIALWISLPYLAVTTGGAHACDVHAGVTSGSSADTWQRLWAPLQIVVMAGALLQAARFWRPQPEPQN